MNIGIALVATLFLGFFYSWTSRINGLFFFGRSLDPDLRVSSEAQVITRRYRISVIAATLVAAVLACLLASHSERFVASGPMLLAVGFWFIFARANREARTLQSSHPGSPGPVVQVDLAQAPTYWIPGWSAALLPVTLAMVVLVGSAMFAAHGMDLSMGWGIVNRRLEVDRLDGLFDTSVGLLGAAITLLITLKTSVRLRTRMAQYSVRASVLLLWVGLALFSAVLVSEAAGVTISHRVARGIVIAGVLGTLGITIWNQKRSSQFIPPAAELGFDDRWHWGLFYVNESDPALFVQSRCGTGYSLNYGRTLAWPIAFALVAYFMSMLILYPPPK